MCNNVQFSLLSFLRLYFSYTTPPSTTSLFPQNLPCVRTFHGFHLHCSYPCLGLSQKYQGLYKAFLSLNDSSYQEQCSFCFSPEYLFFFFLLGSPWYLQTLKILFPYKLFAIQYFLSSFALSDTIPSVLSLTLSILG